MLVKLLKEQTHRISEHVHRIRRMQVVQRITYSTDTYSAEVNNEYVMYYSIAMSIVILLTSLFQTYFIKKLFSSPTVGSKEYKLRA